MNALIREVDVTGAADGPLAGETFAVKANIAVAGEVWDGASPALAEVVAETHATTVARILDAGGTIVGQANMHELAFGITSANAAFGAVESPHGGMAGGSSGGTAAAVGGGLATMGLGSDTGGSGRLPAAFCGCAGLRPTTGRYPSDGVLVLSASLDTVTPMARDVAALGRLDAVLAASDTALPVSDAALPERALAGVRLAMISDPCWTRIDPRVRTVLDGVLDRLRGAGALIETREAPGLTDAIAATALPLVMAETRRWWVPFARDRLGLSLAELAERIASPDVAEIFRGAALDETDDAALAALQNEGMARVRTILEAAIDGCDAAIHPTVPIAAPPVGAETAEVEGETHPLFPLLTDRALVASLAGAPAVTLPIAGFDRRPLGVELLGRPDGDRELLGLAAAVEAVLPAAGKAMLL